MGEAITAGRVASLRAILIRSLLLATTASWPQGTAITVPLATRLDELREAGWRIRSASPRNYELWHCWLSGAADQCLVMIHGGQTLNAAEASLLIINELDRAHAPGNLDTLASSVAELSDDADLFRTASWKLHLSLSATLTLLFEGRSVPGWFSAKPSPRLTRLWNEALADVDRRSA